MSRTITTAAELDALPVGSVVLGADLPDVPRRPLGERISPRRDPDARWNVDGRHYYGATETVLAVLGGAATVLHDPPAPAPAPSVVPEAAVERAARAMQAENAPKPDPLNRDQREEQDDATIATYRTLTRAALTAALPLLTAAPSATREEVARALEGEFGCFLARDPHRPDAFWGGAADALLARFTITPKEDR